MTLSAAARQSLTAFAGQLIDQRAARIAVAPQAAAPGYWFGGGNLTQGPDGALYLVGRYRNPGDSRSGLAAGERGLELAIFRSADQGQSFAKILSFAKADLDVGRRRVLSIEGSALAWQSDGSGVELFVSTEKDGVGYPTGLEAFRKPGTGVWSIDRLAAPSLAELKSAAPATVIESRDPRFLHVKDPFVWRDPRSAALYLFCCTHPYCWSSSNTAFAIRPAGAATFQRPTLEFFRRGYTWDVAMTRGTCVLELPRADFALDQDVCLMFYDGGESLRNLDEHTAAVRRPRGYSCEEIGGLACFLDYDPTTIQRLSEIEPLFLSPHGTGCSRYVDVLATPAGYFATWQQSQPDGSQPLVIHFVPRE